ncbi:hypothetical protein [Patiriisocius marinus]|uniref:hypothetical protein n=1 Tax=Patiriisocius marinus TaxID=1397112 RepID=UPI00232E2402|nr:hypothetical protein [Patiriisocius marinus]
MSKRYWAIAIILNLIIASSFFVKNIGVGYSAISSDLQNIIPMCLKLDNPDLYKGDLFADDISNFKYYTPFFISTLREISSWVNYDYIKGLNILLFATNLLYGLTWFFLFFKAFKNHFLLAVFLSVLVRGVVWLPGSEMWGIGDMWTMMPRTLYAAFLPLPFIVLFLKTEWKYIIGGLVLGIILNFHPISGLGGVLIWFLLLLLLKYLKKYKISLFQIALSLIATVVGMLPFVVVYFTKTEIALDYDPALYQEAIRDRIAPFFFDTGLFLKQWLKVRYLFYLLPLIGLLCWTYFKYKEHFKNSLVLALLSCLLVVIPTISIPLESLANNLLGTNIRMSFQLVRIQKLAILPGYFAIGYLIYFFSKSLNISIRFGQIALVFYLLIIVFSSENIFNNVSLIGDDISRDIFPKTATIFAPVESKQARFDMISNYINEHIPEDAVFYRTFFFRPSTKRSVALDGKGASIIIEGNPKKLIDWYLKRKKIASINSEIEKYAYISSLGIDYWLTKDEIFLLEKVHEVNGLFLYKFPKND